MKFSLAERQKFKQQIERILHVPGNYTGGVLEMALVLDMRLSEKEIKETAAEIARTLKQQSEVFRNVRLNLIEWKPEEKIGSRVVPLPLLMMGSFVDEYVLSEGILYMDDLLSYLKLFQARSKVILIVTAGNVGIRDTEASRKYLKPFLGRKLYWISEESHELEVFLTSERCGYLQILRTS